MQLSKFPSTVLPLVLKLETLLQMCFHQVNGIWNLVIGSHAQLLSVQIECLLLQGQACSYFTLYKIKLWLSHSKINPNLSMLRFQFLYEIILWLDPFYKHL